MPAPAPPPGPLADAAVRAVGEALRAHRKALKLSAVTTAEAAGLSRVTLHRIETGNASVTVGAVSAVAAALGLTLVVVDPQAHPTQQEPLPERLTIADHPQLQQLAWQLGAQTTLTPAEALSIYERNWRHVDVAALSDEERALIRRLTRALGGRLLV